MVTSFGELADPTTLKGHVKLQQGIGIILTRDDARNAIKVEVELPPGIMTEVTVEEPPNKATNHCNVTIDLAVWV